MGEKTGISWCDHTFNPWIGCSKVSAGCEHCYAERENNYYRWVSGWGAKASRRRTIIKNWKSPLAWNKVAMLSGIRRKVFCGSLCDVFEDRPELADWRQELFDLIEETEWLDWLILTKRIENVVKWYGTDVAPDEIRQNAWLGVTCENQQMADERIPLLLSVPSKVHFISIEPMLTPIDLDLNGRNYGRDYDTWSEWVDWVICGGESGPGARPMQTEWALNVRDQCKVAKVPFFFKQVGGTKRIDGHWGGDLLDGVEYKEFPHG